MKFSFRGTFERGPRNWAGAEIEEGIQDVFGCTLQPLKRNHIAACSNTNYHAKCFLNTLVAISNTTALFSNHL